MKSIYIIRHCQAEGQAADAQLTDLGVKQSNELTAFLSDKNIDLIVSSPYERAIQTIQPFADKAGIEIKLDDRLVERVLSRENLPNWKEMLRETYDDLDLNFKGGESSNTAISRAVTVVNDILNHTYENSVIVSHGNLISLLLKHFDNSIGFKEWEALSNPDMYHLSFEDNSTNLRRVWND
ncbi:histidine phosphatase family protein [Pseudalkalibacillus decolorationis]|uniref:histidine phosphatase family protein n=1 Tax=Pseudalkalibacillus decolorationis TaxID=163879 RepID=UPI002148BCB9|nr:histidine phosphatase family protein [Pseudalkalibacillus decolorationis]